MLVLNSNTIQFLLRATEEICAHHELPHVLVLYMAFLFQAETKGFRMGVTEQHQQHCKNIALAPLSYRTTEGIIVQRFMAYKEEEQRTLTCLIGEAEQEASSVIYKEQIILN